MIIKRLVLHNYRRFSDVELECPENVIGIIGRNGSGKTTLVEAIGWALYGNVIARTGKSDIRSQFAGESDPCSVELEFEYGGEEYRVVRQLKGRNAIAEAAIYRAAAAEPEAVQERGVNEYVERLLRLDYRSFFASVFARQRELAALSSMTAEERRKSIARLINIDRIDKARERVLADRLGKNKFIEGMRSALVDPDMLEEQIASAAAESLRLRGILEEAREVVTVGETALQQARSGLEDLTRLRDAWQAHQSMIMSWQASQAENRASLLHMQDDLKAIDDAGRELVPLHVELKDLAPLKRERERLDGEELRQVQRESLLQQQNQAGLQIAASQARIGALQERAAGLAGLEEEWRELLQREADLEKRVEEAREAQQHWKSELTATTKAGNETRAKKEQIEKLGPEGECPTCTQRLAEHYPQVLAEMEEKLTGLRQSWQSAGKDLAAAEERVAECDRSLRLLRVEKEKLLQRITADREAAGSLDQLRADQAAAEQRMGEIAGALAALGTVAYDREVHAATRLRQAELEKLQRRADQMEERVRRRPQVIAEIARVEGVLQEFKRMEADAQAEQARLGYDEKAYEAANSALKAVTKALLDAKESHAKAREAAARSQTAEEALQAQKEQQQKKRQEIAAAQEEIVYLDALDVYLKKFRLDLAGRIRPLLARRASELIALTTRGRYTHLELDEEYLISLYDGNRLFPLGRFSGGEQDLANLCLRVAISQILAERSGGAPINFIVLDEIFGSQDEERKAAILDALGQLSSQFRQIFMITHVDSIRDQLQVIWEVALADEQNSQVRMV